MAALLTYQKIAVLETGKPGISITAYDSLGQLIEAQMYSYCARHDVGVGVAELQELLDRVKAQVAKDNEPARDEGDGA